MNNNNTLSPLTRLITLRWFDHGTHPNETLASLLEHLQIPYTDEIVRDVEGMIKHMSMATFVQGNAVDVRITSFHGLIDLDTELYPVLTNSRAADEQIVSRAVFSLDDMGMDSGEKLSSLRTYVRFVQHTWALPGCYIGLSMHVVREIASLAYWKNWTLEFHLDQCGNALVIAVRFPKLQDMDFVINVFRENDQGCSPYPVMQEWLRLFRSILDEVAEVWTIRILVNETIAERIGCLKDDDVVVTREEVPPYPCPQIQN
jgi:hypothetical protein